MACPLGCQSALWLLLAQQCLPTERLRHARCKLLCNRVIARATGLFVLHSCPSYQSRQAMCRQSLRATQQMLLAPSGFLACCNRRTPIDAVNSLLYTSIYNTPGKVLKGYLSRVCIAHSSLHIHADGYEAIPCQRQCCCALYIHTSIARGLDGEADSASGRQLLSHKPPQPTVVSTSTSQVARSLHSLVLKLSPRQQQLL